jgi:transcriptional antiterminator RfaH
MTARWYVAQCHPKCEPWALKNSLKQQFRSYWPRYELRRKIGAGSVYYKGVFPGYIFVEFDTQEPGWKSICSTYGIRKILGANEYGAQPLPYGFIEGMMAGAQDGLIEAPKTDGVKFNVGDELQILDGPLTGHKGIMQYSEKGRISLLLTLLNRKISVILPSDKVQYAGASL